MNPENGEPTISLTPKLAMQVGGVLLGASALYWGFVVQLGAITSRMDAQTEQFAKFEQNMKELGAQMSGLRSDLDKQEYLRNEVDDLKRQQAELRSLVIERVGR